MENSLYLLYISMAMFNSYLKLPEGNMGNRSWLKLDIPICDKNPGPSGETPFGFY